MNSEHLFRTLDVFLPSSYLSLRLPLRHRTPWILILEVGFSLYLAFTWLNTEICPIGLPKVCSVNHSVLNVSGVFRNKNSSAYSSLKLRSACEIGCACADLMHAIGLASSWLISHVVNKEEIEFKAGNNPMSEVICTVSWKDSQLEWNLKRWQSQPCWVFTVSYLFSRCSRCNNEYITHYFQLLHVVM